MVAASRAASFTDAFVLAVPVMPVMFRDGGECTGRTPGMSLMPAASAAVIAATTVGGGRQ
ncbi:hypothetical protein [Streptomyces sp. ALI-76-A]|uniref:hypothetical protein n=1 Tax=Streptomyces sp. ALI-76-A TaxID=3025736 RepID=UPI00256F589B|nr:hypothetical protein [Streptomyces sp. ALI-76-A]MDL5206018.1 hypothetical protein [Streptomyces sp. ALI-76-A]